VYASASRDVSAVKHASSRLSTGDTATFTIAVSNSSVPLKVTLVWTDPPASPAASKQLVNDLDLEVVNPAGTTTYLGNAYITGTTQKDTVNNVENVIVSSPAIGSWTVRVKGTAVPVSAPQDYAVVATYAGTCPMYSLL